MDVSLQSANAASTAGAQLWYLRQTNASADYAGLAAGLVSKFPALQTTMVRAFVADRMSLTLTPAQVVAAKAKLQTGPPAGFTQVLEVAAAPYQHSGAPEAVALRAAVLGATPSLQAELADLPAAALELPAVFASSSITSPEVRLAKALRSYADSILAPVPGALPAAGAEQPAIGAGLVLDGEAQHQATEALSETTDLLDGLSALAKQFGGEAGEGAAETSFEPLGEAFGYAFAASTFIEAGDALQVGADADGVGGEAGGQGASAGTYGDPHQMTFSRAEYDFQAVGEFTLVKSTTDDLEIQVRQAPFPGAGSIAVDTATAMRVDGTLVELAANAARQPGAVGQPPARAHRRPLTGRRREDRLWPRRGHCHLAGRDDGVGVLGDHVGCRWQGDLQCQQRHGPDRYGATGALRPSRGPAGGPGSATRRAPGGQWCRVQHERAHRAMGQRPQL